MITHQTFKDWITSFLREGQMDCHGLSPIIDNVDTDGMQSFGVSMGVLGEAQTVTVDCKGHCPACNRKVAFVVQLQIGGIESHVFDIPDDIDGGEHEQ